jgi:Putative intracellular protease/amidase
MAASTHPNSRQQRVLIVVGDAAETLDTLYPYYRLQEAGFEPVVIGPEKRIFQMVMHEVRPGWTITKEWEGYQIKAELAFADVRPEDYVGIFFSGGRAPEYIRYNEDLVRITRHFFAANKPVASVCHGVEIPAYAGCLEGQGSRRWRSAATTSRAPVAPTSTRRAWSMATS